MTKKFAPGGFQCWYDDQLLFQGSRRILKVLSFRDEKGTKKELQLKKKHCVRRSFPTNKRDVSVIVVHSKSKSDDRGLPSEIFEEPFAPDLAKSSFPVGNNLNFNLGVSL